MTFKTCVIAAISHTPAYRRGRFAKAERLKSRKLIQTLFREGKVFSVFPYKVYYQIVDLPASPYPVQAGFTVSKRSFPRAVDRNRIKRLGREAWRLQKHALYDLVQRQSRQIIIFFIYTGKEIPSYHLVSDKFLVILKKLTSELGDKAKN